MHYITLDTNTWIYLANGTEPVRILNFIVQETIKGNICILLPHVIVDEWERNKEKSVTQGSLQHFKDIKAQLSRIKQLIDNERGLDAFDFLLDDEERSDQVEMTVLIEYIDQFKKKRQSIEKAVKRNIELIDELFTKHAKIIEISAEVYVKAGNAALDKKAPFARNKNSFADAIIVFSFLDHVKRNNIKGAKFISYNVEDFCEKANGVTQLHPDLVHEFDECQSEYHKIVGQAFQSIKEDIISKEELAYIEEWQEGWDDELEYCEVCSDIHERASIVNFSELPLEDDRYNPDQLMILFDDQTSQISDINSTITAGECEYCSTEYFICVDCCEMNTVHEFDYDEPIECVGCGLGYVIRCDYDRDGIIVSKAYSISSELFKCEKCCNVFSKDLMNGSLCLNCEDEYSYGG
jgi:hypothetical protein